MREPVILVTDIYFDTIYGSRYSRMSRIESYCTIFRQIRLIRIMEDTSSLSIIETVNKISKKPYAVFFPYAYSEAAAYYADDVEKNKSPVKIFVIGNHNSPKSEPSNFIFIKSGSGDDFFLAGMCASILTEETGSDNTASAALPSEGSPYKSVFIYDGSFDIPDRDAFNRGLAERGVNIISDFAESYEQRDWEEASSIVIYGSAHSYMQTGVSVPVVLFSWYNDEHYMPDNIKVVASDSPYYIISKALSAVIPANARTIAIPCKFTTVDKNINNKSVMKDLWRTISLKK